MAKLANRAASEIKLQIKLCWGLYRIVVHGNVPSTLP